MSDLHLISVFLIGLLGSVHCVGMCGGIVGALSVASGERRPFPVAVVSGAAALTMPAAQGNLLRVVAYNGGRIASYMIAGALAGGVAQGVRALSFMSSLQIGGYWLANLMLVALGLYLMDAWHGLTKLEALGQIAWRRIKPLIGRFLPMDNAFKAFALGGLWGWVPCGMVYSVLLTAMLSGSALSGAMLMLAFGLGTLPVLLSMGMLGTRLQAWTRQRKVRVASGLLVLAFGLLGLARAANGLSLGWLDSICVTPAPSHEDNTGRLLPPFRGKVGMGVEWLSYRRWKLDHHTPIHFTEQRLASLCRSASGRHAARNPRYTPLRGGRSRTVRFSHVGLQL